MTMLPTTPSNQELAPILIGVYSVATHSNMEFLARSFGLTSQNYQAHQNRTYADIAARTTAVFIDDQTMDLSLLEACDGVIFVLDASLGVNPQAIALWQELAGLEIPRHIVATNLFQTHTDFDELVAISRRIFSENVLVRHLPMADDEDSKVIALYDLLQNQIFDYSNGEQVITNPDTEHIELTSDQRDSLFESLAYLGLGEDAFKMFQAGITPAISQFEQAWATDSIISISPLDENVGQKIVQDWLRVLPNRWSPLFESDEYQTHTSEPGFYGLGIANGLARVWGNANTAIEITDSTGETEGVTESIKLASCIVAENIAVGDTLHEQGQSLTLTAPIFD